MRLPNLDRLPARPLRYLAVGASVNATGYVAYLGLTWGGLSPRLAVTVLLPISLWTAFQLHGHITFAGGGRSRAASLRFLVISLAGYALNLVLLAVLVDGAGIPHELAQLVALGLIALTMFQLLRRLVYTTAAPHPQGP